MLSNVFGFRWVNLHPYFMEFIGGSGSQQGFNLEARLRHRIGSSLVNYQRIDIIMGI